MNKKTKLLGLLLSSAIALGSVQPVTANDLDGHWARNIILEMQSKNIISGYADGTFKPNADMTRAEFIKVINRAFALKGNSDQKFTDVRPEDWFAGDVAIAFANGYLKGFPDGSFKPNAVISRAEAAVILSRILKLEEDAAAADKFTDSSLIPAWAKGSIGALTKAGYLKGYPDGGFGHDKHITRSEAFSLVYAPSNDYQIKQDSLKKELAHKNQKTKPTEKAKPKEKEQAQKPQTTDQSSPAPSAPSTPAPQPQPEKKLVQSISFAPANFDIAEEAGQIAVTVNYHPAKAVDKGVTWTLVNGSEVVAITNQTANSITLKALDNGNYEVKAVLSANQNIMKTFSGNVSHQVITLVGNVGMAADKSIQELTTGNTYILKTADKYYTVNAHGKMDTPYDDLEFAKLFSTPLATGITAITDLDNAKSYELIEISHDDLAVKINTYLGISIDSLNLKNLAATEALGNVLAIEIPAKIDDLNNQGKTELKDKLNDIYVRQFTPKKQAIDEKIQALKVEQEQKVTSIKEQLQNIVPQLEIDNAETILSMIESYQADLEDSVWQAIDGLEKYRQLKKEFNQYKAFDAYDLMISDNGEIAVEIADLNVQWELLKESGASYTGIANGKALATAIPTQLQMMRKSGVGNYKLQLTAKLEYIQELSRESEAKAVRLLNNDLGGLKLNNQLEIIQDAPKIRFNLAEGYLEWDAIESATTYDVRAEMTIKTSESNIGGEFLIPTDIVTDYSNMENEFSKSILDKVNDGRWFKVNHSDDSSRSFVAIGLDQPRVALDKIRPHMGTNLNPEGFYQDLDQTENLAYIKLWIIPRNQNSLYLSDMKTYVKNINSISANLLIEHIPFLDYLKKLKITN